MTLAIAAFVWYVVGVLTFYATLVAIDPVVRVKDLFVMAVGGLMGPLNILYWLIYAKHPWMEKQVLGGKK